MGLDISYLSKVELYNSLVEDVEEDDYEEGSSRIYEQEEFKYQLGSLANYSHYSETENSEYGSFRGGSYSGYNMWREVLARMAGYANPEEVWKDFDAELERVGDTGKMKPFYELICFSDCEGLIGPEISKKLYEDFVAFQDKAKEFKTELSWFYSNYLEWMEAFRVASDNGVVSFH